MRLGGGHAAPAFGTEAEGPALAPLAGRGGPAFRRRSPLLLLFPLFLVVMSGSRVVRLHSSIAIQRSAATFPSVDGILTEVRYRTDNKMQGIYPKYQYIVDGSEYAGTRYRYIRHRMEDDECVALAKSLSQRIGASVPVYYDPADPTVAMLDPGAINPGELWQLYLKGYFYLAFSGVFLLAGLVGVLVPRRVRADYTGMRTPAGLPQDSSGSPASKPAE